jgi:hypothetical protein
MKHVHEYESTYHRSPSPEAKALGIDAVEVKKCKTCSYETINIVTKKGAFPLFEARDAEDQDILLA